MYNDPTIGSYNHWHLTPNGIPSGSQRWYGLVHLVYKRLVILMQDPGNNRVALGTLFGRETCREHIRIKLRKLGEYYTSHPDNIWCRQKLLKRLKE